MPVLMTLKRFAMWTIVAAALVLGPTHFTNNAAAAQKSPIFGNAQVATLTMDGAKHVTAKGYYGALWGSYALTYLSWAYTYQTYAYYYSNYYGYYAYYYGNLGANYALAAYVATNAGI